MAFWASNPSFRLHLQVEMEHLPPKNLQIDANLLKGVELGDENTRAPGLDAAISFISGGFNPTVDLIASFFTLALCKGEIKPCL